MSCEYIILYDHPDLNKSLDQRHLQHQRLYRWGLELPLHCLKSYQLGHFIVLFFYYSYIIYFVTGPNMGRCLVVCSHELVKNGAYGNMVCGVFKRGIQN